ncbi:ABC transporter permease [Microbacterium thalassium]|uniref:Multidrug/hemolysin transport system permease protein n=1 Tax=Microbacterium thalassium TaxID=362649 RepID=A0A7X0FR25_9MICO|nr:ABC transporter permease [Microbacterium thalassium]MBB6391526.1 multidrug/hemolysin transport system permease protein [Microbacterium thalassium]GLK24080.1 ABC transporter permease [Microbacterium thalassium]
MSVVWALAVRNLRLFFRDRLNVFFSLLGAIILFGLYTMFLSNLQTADLAANLPGATADEVQVFVDSWMFAGIVLITTVTTGLGGFSTLVDDGQTGRFRDFLVAPLRRGQLVLGYLIAAIIISLVMSLIVFAVALLYLGILRDAWMPVDAILRSLGIVVLSCVSFTSLAALLASFVRTSGAFSGLATIVGTVLGFIAAAYLPMGLLPGGVASGLSALPFAQAGMLLRREFAADNLSVIVADAPGAEETLRTFFGLDLTIGDWAVPDWFVVVVLLVVAVVCAVLSALRIRARMR